MTFLAEADGAPPRVGFAIGRSLGGAVQRNRLRRRTRAVMQDLTRREPGALPCGSYLVRLSPAASPLPFTELQRHVRTAVTRAVTKANGSRR